MKRRTNFWIAFTTAAITFGSLMVFAGTEKSGWNRDRCGWSHYRQHDYNNNMHEEQNHQDNYHP